MSDIEPCYPVILINGQSIFQQNLAKLHYFVRQA